MNVFIVTAGREHEGHDTIGVFSNEEQAHALAQEQRNSRHHYTFAVVTTWVVGDTSSDRHIRTYTFEDPFQMSGYQR